MRKITKKVLLLSALTACIMVVDSCTRKSLDEVNPGTTKTHSGARCLNTTVEVYVPEASDQPPAKLSGGDSGLGSGRGSVDIPGFTFQGYESVSIGCGEGAGEPNPNDPPRDAYTNPANADGTTAGGGYYGTNGNPPAPTRPASLDDYDENGRYIGTDPYYMDEQRINDVEELSGYNLMFDGNERAGLHKNMFALLPIRELINYGINSVSQAEAHYIAITQGAGLHPEERRILSDGNLWHYKVNLFIYVGNAIKATLASNNTTKIWGGADCGHCKKNAYRHGLFSALNAMSFGYNMTRQLGGAHELATQPGELNALERQMDTYNNYAGLKVFNENSFRLFDYTMYTSPVNDPIITAIKTSNIFWYIRGGGNESSIDGKKLVTTNTPDIDEPAGYGN